jgi:hypothetical protein
VKNVGRDAVLFSYIVSERKSRYSIVCGNSMNSATQCNQQGGNKHHDSVQSDTRDTVF